MLSDASLFLADDHDSVDKVLKRLRAAIERGDADASLATLDLFWARLAVHIRAEHLHLFPTVLTHINRRSESLAEHSQTEARSTVEKLRGDHDFFMHELASAVATARELIKIEDQVKLRAGLDIIGKIVTAVEKKLREHNELEEQTIYRWVDTILNEEEQMTLANKIDKELEKRPARFTKDSWREL